MSSRFDAYRVDGDTVVDVAFWNRIFREVDARIASVEDKKASFEEAERLILELGLQRINSTLLPAAERIFRVAELGFLIASSDEEVAFYEGQEASITIREGDQRGLFTPSPFIALTRRSTPDDYVIGQALAYDPESGVLLVDVITVVGTGGPFDDWDVAALAGSVMAMVAALEETRSLRQGVADDAQAASSAKDTAVSAKDTAVDAAASAAAALNSFVTVYRGASATPPENGEVGHFYFDTALQQARVYSSAGWIPLFTVALGGVRQGYFVATDDQTEFSADGDFSFINVFKNGVLLTPVDDYTVASPDFTLTSGATEGDIIAYLAYHLSDHVDFYTKSVADDLFGMDGGTY